MASPKFRHALLFGDTHEPFSDPKAKKCIERIVADVRPDVLVHMGDLIDCYSLSRFDKAITRKADVQADIDTSAAWLKALYMLSPNAERYYLEGNHEFRLTKTIEGSRDQVREVMGLRTVQRATAWKSILEDAGVDAGMWEFVPRRGQTRRRIFPRFILKHGDRVSAKSGYTAFREMDRYGCSGASGHTHRLGHVFHNDFNGAHCWLETGCTCDLLPEYVEDPDWQHGCVLITFTTDYRFFSPSAIYIQEGNAIYGDRRIKV